MSTSVYVSCGLVLLGISNLLSSAVASGVALKRAHPLFGKCTSSDRIVGTSGSEISFLQDGASLPSDTECMQMLAQNDVLSSAALSLSEENSGEDDWSITKSSSAQEIISHALSLLTDDAALDAAQSDATLRKIWKHMKEAAKESSLFVLGLGPELYALSKLVDQQFGDVPISSLVVLGRYPVAKLLMMQKFLDQSTVIVARSRMTAEGLSALSGLMRVLVLLEDGHRTDAHSRLFSPAEKEDHYLQYATPQWELQDDLAPLQLLDSARQDLLSGSFAEGVSDEKRAALETYLSVYEQALRRGTDEQWKQIKASLESLTLSATKKANFDIVLEAARKYAVKIATASASKTGLQEYLKLLEETLAKQAKNDIQIHAVTYEFIANAANLTASPNALEKLKDSIENACELAESRPQLLLPALRLIQAGLLGEEYMIKVYKVLEGFKKLGPEADVSALSSAASSVEL
ncbi:hypothetical protein Emag_004004 [Eimeria magna]